MILFIIIIIEAVFYALSAWLDYSQTRKILKKYAKYPHPYNLPQ